MFVSGSLGLVSASSASVAKKVPVARIVALAKVLSKELDNGFVWSKTNSPTLANQIVPYGKWRGPTSAPAPAKTAVVDVVVCTSGSVACSEAGQGVQAAAALLGWTVHVYDGGFNPAGYATAYASAMADKPNAIIGVAVPADQIQAQLSAAKAAGIITVAVGDIPPKTAGDIPYNSYVDFRMPLMESMLAYYEIAKTNGKANTIVATDTSFGSLIQAMKQYDNVMATCSTCKVHNIQWSLADAFNAATITADINGALAADRKANAITLPYSIVEPTVLQGCRRCWS
jgi:ABC-type sugar transport system substrate-binding protein